MNSSQMPSPWVLNVIPHHEILSTVKQAVTDKSVVSGYSMSAKSVLVDVLHARLRHQQIF